MRNATAKFIKTLADNRPHYRRLKKAYLATPRIYRNELLRRATASLAAKAKEHEGVPQNTDSVQPNA